MSKDIKKALEHCVEWNCGNCPNRDELGSGETVCRGRLLPEVLEYVADLEAKLAEKDEQLRAKIGNMESNDFIKMCLQCGLMIDAKEKDIQDKISFCIEKLEKVKELMRNIDMPNKPELYNNDMFGAGFDSHYIRVEKLIDNQINELKGKVETILTHQHEDKGE